MCVHVCARVPIPVLCCRCVGVATREPRLHVCSFAHFRAHGAHLVAAALAHTSRTRTPQSGANRDVVAIEATFRRDEPFALC